MVVFLVSFVLVLGLGCIALAVHNAPEIEPTEEELREIRRRFDKNS